MPVAELQKADLAYGMYVSVSPEFAIKDGGTDRAIASVYGGEGFIGRISGESYALPSSEVCVAVTYGGRTTEDDQDYIRVEYANVPLKYITVFDEDPRPYVQPGDIIEPIAMHPHKYIADGFVGHGEVRKMPTLKSGVITAEFIGKDEKKYTRTVHAWKIVRRRSSDGDPPEVRQLKESLHREVLRRKKENRWCDVTSSVLEDLGLIKSNLVTLTITVDMGDVEPTCKDFGYTVAQISQRLDHYNDPNYLNYTIKPVAPDA